MKVFSLPAKTKALIFDMDLTLYTNPEYGQYQIDILVERLGGLKGLSFDEMNSEVEKVRKEWKLSHNGKEMSLTKILMDYGISMEEVIAWRNELFEPGRFIKEDKLLKETLDKLSELFILGIVTNNPVLVARKTLALLGVDESFPVIVGLDTCMTAKPNKKPFEKFIDLANCPGEICVSIGDRFDIDIGVPLEMGMGGILVDGVEDVYRLPELLKGCNPDRKLL
ncbi:MAG: HAD family hydrolase [Treponema sp.]|jgi:phosphoglycolate phosphatase/putative hydrolase of the HAD superfamily|nr:HAD family hydrolase [Treponema sp.]